MEAVRAPGLVVVDGARLLASSGGPNRARWRGCAGSSPPQLGLSATLGNLDVARDTLLGLDPTRCLRRACLIRGEIPKALEVDALIPETMERFPWSGQMGLRMVPDVVRAIEEGESALVFTNTRATPRSGIRRCSLPDRLGGHHGATPWLHDRGTREGSRTACVSRCAASCAPPRSTSAWISRSIASSDRSPKAVGRPSSVPGAVDTSREPSAGSRACTKRLELRMWPPLAARKRADQGADRSGSLDLSRSTPSRSRSAGFLTASCSTKFARPTPIATSPGPSGPGCSTSSPTAATRCARTPSTARSWCRTGATWSPAGWSRCAIASRSARS